MAKKQSWFTKLIINIKEIFVLLFSFINSDQQNYCPNENQHGAPTKSIDSKNNMEISNE